MIDESWLYCKSLDPITRWHPISAHMTADDAAKACADGIATAQRNGVAIDYEVRHLDREAALFARRALVAINARLAVAR